MLRVTSMLPSWDRNKTDGRKGVEKSWGWAGTEKVSGSVNKSSNKISSEALWPTTIDKESNKAARILKSFCKDGFYADDDQITHHHAPRSMRHNVRRTIPQKVIKNAVGLVIFTTMRTGLWVSSSGGSGVFMARMENGEWSPPSAVLLQTAGLGFLFGVDVYDCVLVINNRRALHTFRKTRVTLGGETGTVVGPTEAGGLWEPSGRWKKTNPPVFSYLKSRGLFYAGAQVDGTVIMERNDENERFYGQRLGVADIISGNIQSAPVQIKILMETVKAAEGRTDTDRVLMEELATQPSPADIDVQTPQSATFGIPEAEDPDPYGVLALEKAGFEIREAGTRSRPVSSQFEFNPSPTSPMYSRFNRMSFDTMASWNNRGSGISTRTRYSTDRATQTMEIGTQTENMLGTNPSYSECPKSATESTVPEPESVDYTKIDLGPLAYIVQSPDLDGTTLNDSSRDADSNEDRSISKETSYLTEDDDDDASDDLDGLDELEDDDFEDEPMVFEGATEAAQATVITPAKKARAGLVNIPKRPPPPPLPLRSPARIIDTSNGHSPGSSPLRDEFAKLGRKNRHTKCRSLMTPTLMIPPSPVHPPRMKELVGKKAAAMDDIDIWETSDDRNEPEHDRLESMKGEGEEKTEEPAEKAALFVSDTEKKLGTESGASKAELESVTVSSVTESR